MVAIYINTKRLTSSLRATVSRTNDGVSQLRQNEMRERSNNIVTIWIVSYDERS